MLTIVEGDLGTGKTLLLSHYGDLEREVFVYPNYNLDVPKFKKKISPFDIENLYVGLVLLQGFYTWLDCRLSSSELNRYLTRDLVFNSRKRELNLIVDLQLEDSIDKRFYKLASLKIDAHGLCELPNGKQGYVYTYNSIKRGKIIGSKDKVLPLERAEYLYDIYNTYEPEKTIQPSMYEPERLNNYINKAVLVIRKLYPEKDITKNMINDILLEKGKSIPSKRIIDLVYSRLKRKNE